ncbi:SLOG family protein [Streptomyces coelicoflavus]|uniref:SLOG family protein n=1 Tax=Streptomyces coelicoflavus TaxID=285562 RepID=UPI0036A7C5F2
MVMTSSVELSDPRVLVCGDRRWLWPGTVTAVLDRLAARYGDRLIVIEGAASGADRAAHCWCKRNGLGPDRHRCHPVDWKAERLARPKTWRLAGPERNTRMLRERPRLIVAFHSPVRSWIRWHVQHVSAGPDQQRARMAGAGPRSGCRPGAGTSRA